ncbi:DUF1501 domain-containing protein [Plantactinospora endophytica]|uniref:DUF1501 domain-containing protein n=1 Tax=Plantactinospora endophytica TaxID=673535 RepID=A0ABQ4E9H0_9ACTN|nr:DUF1501 domain-containing protein [Plantactinospora endophytica]GIG91373.1 hypothetical protein Pen02_63090 [Plantactinospora endophytica]
MDALTRRRFLVASGVVGGGALATTGAALGLAELLDKSSRAAPPDPGGKLVLVTLYGGNDGLNTVIPYADRRYHGLRPELAYPAEQVLHLDDALGLNPKLRGLKRLWDAKRLAVVLGVGYPKPDRSHFRSMDIWQTASPGVPIYSGWVGRWLDGTNATPETAVSFEPVLPPLLAGETRSGACVSLGGLRLPPGIDDGLVGALGVAQPGEPAMQARAAASYADLLRVDHLVRHSQETARAESGPSGPATGTGGSSALAAQLALVARCVEANVPTRVYSVSLGGFDTHASLIVGHELLLTQLDEALTGFVERMARTEAGRQVTVVVYSEFGRRVRGNASDGTDHGTAGPVLVLGGQVTGGLYGEQPSLSDLDDGDLKATVDFRQVYGTVLGAVLGADPARYLDGFQVTPLPFLPAG